MIYIIGNKHADLHYEEIYKLEYCGKVIYVDKNFKFEEEQTDENAIEIA